MATPRAILLDIEGTTTSIAFVYETLFPFMRRAVEAFLVAHLADPEVQADIDLIRGQAAADKAEGVARVPQVPGVDAASGSIRAGALANIAWQMDSDRKTTGLKSLQGKVWAQGYADGSLKGHLYPDVAPTLHALHGLGVPVFIYSSGSIAAQKLIFGHSIAGDLRPLIAGYFDTTTGPKKSADSYTLIAEAIGAPAGDILFVSDSVAELQAASAAGLQAWLSLRPGNAPVPADHGFPAVDRFDGLVPRA